MEITKTCTNCKEKKALINFNKHKYAKDGLFCYCKECRYIKNKIYHLKYIKNNLNKQKETERKSKYYFKNKEKYLKKNKKYAKNNIEKVKIWQKNFIDKSIKNLSDSYIINSCFKKYSHLEIPKEIIELKRIQLKTFRLCQQLQN